MGINVRPREHIGRMEVPWESHGNTSVPWESHGNPMGSRPMQYVWEGISWESHGNPMGTRPKQHTPMGSPIGSHGHTAESVYARGKPMGITDDPTLLLARFRKIGSLKRSGFSRFRTVVFRQPRQLIFCSNAVKHLPGDPELRRSPVMSAPRRPLYLMIIVIAIPGKDAAPAITGKDAASAIPDKDAVPAIPANTTLCCGGSGALRTGSRRRNSRRS